MIVSLSNRITALLLSQKIIKEEDKEIYSYGFQIMISNLLGILLIVLIGLITQEFIITAVYYITFVFLRQITGGYHANSYLSCNTTFFVVSLATIFLIRSIGNSVNILSILLMFIFSLITTAVFAPVENKHKPITQERKRYFKILSICITLVLYSLSVFLLYFEADWAYDISLSLSITMTVIAVMMIIGVIKNRINKEGGNSDENEKSIDGYG